MNTGLNNTIDFSSTDDLLGRGGAGRYLTFWNLNSGNISHRYNSECYTDLLQCRSCLNDDNKIFTCVRDGQLRPYDINSNATESILLTDQLTQMVAMNISAPNLVLACKVSGIVT